MPLKRYDDLVGAAIRLLLMIFVCALGAFAVEPTTPSSVDVYWKSTRTIVAPGVSTVVVLDEDIAHAQIGSDTIEFVGLTRGDTVALAYVNGAPVSIVVHVIDRPVNVIPPSLLRRQAEMAHGVISSDVQTTSGNSSNHTLLSSLAWEQHVGDHAMNFNSQVEDNNQFGGHGTNLRTAGLNFRSPGFSFSLIDFSQTITGATPEDRINNFASGNYVELRGAGITLGSNRNQFSLFGGSTPPYYFLSLNGTRDVAGFSFRREQTDKLNFYGGASYVNIPVNFPVGIRRNAYAMETGGVSYHLTKDLLLGGQAGYANDGSRMLRGDFSYASYRLTAYASAIAATQTFPLQQLQSLFSGTSTYKGETDYRITQRLSQRLYYEHTDITPGLIYRVPGSSDYLSPGISYQISRGENLGFYYIYSRNTGGFTSTSSTGNRYDVSLNSQIAPQVGNNAEVTVGSIQDPLQINSEDRLTLRDTVSFPIKRHTVLLGVEHDRVQPSLLSKLNQELNLLSPALQAQFLADPSGFIDSSNFPPEIKALLAAEQPTGTSISVSTIFEFGSKIRFSPSASATHSANGGSSSDWTQTFGYTFSYQFRPTLQFRSSLNNLFLWDTVHNTAQRTTLLSFGFQKTFMAAPGTLAFFHRSRIIEGRVFRDNNINGYFNSGEPGMQGVEVRLDDGEVAITDELGRYKFSSVSADQHDVSIALTQFRNPVRMTTRSDADVDLIQQRIAVVNFGILDFARVMGNVYNDLRFDNARQPDSKGMQDIQLLLENGKEVRKIQTAGSGDFELDDVPPGDYKLSLDPASIPPNYLTPVDSVAVHVSPVSTIVQDIPVRALRSISGTVLLKTAVPNAEAADRKRGKGSKAGNQPAAVPPAQEFKMVPLAGIEIAAGPATATTDADGKFLLRNLPAGELKVTVTPVKPVSAGMNVPSGMVTLPAEPVQIQGATIVITNSDLLPYLSREFDKTPTTATWNNAAPMATTPTDMKPVPMVPAVTSTKPALPTTTEPPVSSTPPASLQAEPSAAATQVSAIPAIAPTESPSRTTAADNTASAPPIPPAVPHADVSGAAPTAPPDGVLTREVCNQLPSLGEIAQCLRQLKLNSTANPK